MPTVGTSLDYFELMGRTIRLANGRLTTEEGTLAGALTSTWPRPCAMRSSWLNFPWRTRCVPPTLTPAQFLGLENERGALVPGARADLAALTDRPESCCNLAWRCKR